MKKVETNRLFRFALAISLALFGTVAGARADLMWINTGTQFGPVRWENVHSLAGDTANGVSATEQPQDRGLRGLLTFPRFSTSLGALEEVSMELFLDLERDHWTEVIGCVFPNSDPDITALIWNRIWFEDGAFDWRPDPSAAPQLIPIGVDEVPGNSKPTELGFEKMVCPLGAGTNVIFPDVCRAAKDIPDIHIESGRFSVTGPALQYTGMGTWDLPFGVQATSIWGFNREVEEPCKAGATLEGRASIGGLAFVQGYYLFSPAVDVFVSDAVNHNVLRFRYDGTDVVREEFIAPGSGGLRYPSGLAFAPDGDLLVASWATTFPFTPSQILRYDGQTGAFRGVFAEDEQLTNPMNMVFGPDGDLYVVVQPSASLLRRERVLRFDGQTGDFDRVFASAPCGYAAPSCELDGAWDLAFGPFGDLYVTARVADVVASFDGATGAFKDIFVDGADGVRDIVWPEGSSSLFLQEGTQVNEYKIDPTSRDAVFWGTVTAASTVAGAGTAIAMGPEMRLGATITTVPSLFAAGNAGIFYFSPPRPRTGNMVFSRGLGSASDVLVRPHVRQTIGRSVGTGDSLVSFAYAGLGVSVRFSQVTADGSLGLAVSEKAPGPGATGFEFLGTYYEFSTLDGLSYLGPVEICINVPPYADPNNAEILHWDGLIWEGPISSSVIGNQVCATFPSLSWFGVALWVDPGDIDIDGDVDRDDLNILLQDRNMLVEDSTCGAPCDLDGDGLITVLDARILTTQCTRPRCATE